MRNSIPTHVALTQEQAGTIHYSIAYAQAILTLIQNDDVNNEGDEPDEFFTSTKTIKTALSAAQYFLEKAQENSSGVYLSLEVEND